VRSGLVVKKEKDTSEGLEETFYNDYRLVDGVMEAFALIDSKYDLKKPNEIPKP
jgi:hypothetical protein